MKFYINILFILLSCTAAVSCSPDDNKKAASPYEQYGEPFAAMPKPEDAIIYQVNIRSFSSEGTIAAVTAKLDYIKDLGATVVYIMPIYPIGQLGAAGAAGSPYSVKDFKAIQPNMGTMEDLRALVDGAHQRNMAVMMDWVANHTSKDNAWVTDHPDWYQHDDNGNMIPPPGTNWTDVYQLDHTNLAMRDAMIDAMSYWVYSANIDGFRCDAADYVPQDFWKATVTAVRSIKNQHLLMLAEGTRIDHFYSGFDYTFGFTFFGGLENTYHNNLPATNLQDVLATEYNNNYVDSQRIVHYTTNHDVNLSDGTPLELFNGKKGSMAAFVIAAYMKSIPMIYNAQEIGYSQRIDFLNTVPIDWSNPDNDLLAEYKKILAFRSSSNAIKSGKYTGYSSTYVSSFTMEKGDEKVLVLANITNAATNYILPASLSGTTWTDAFTGSAANVSAISLAPYQYMVLKN